MNQQTSPLLAIFLCNYFFVFLVLIFLDLCLVLYLEKAILQPPLKKEHHNDFRLYPDEVCSCFESDLAHILHYKFSSSF